MNTRSLPLLIFPILGIFCAWIFRPSEVDWQTLAPVEKTQIKKRSLGLPDGQGIRFIHVPNTSYALSVSEVTDRISTIYDSETASHAGATAFAAWLSEQTGQKVRLPTAHEWRTAARAGLPNTEFPWGFGPPIAPENLHFALPRAPTKPGPAFGYGFRDMGGGLWEWTEEGLLLGSAWSEQNPQTLFIDYSFTPPENYKGKDTGIRLLWELDK